MARHNYTLPRTQRSILRRLAEEALARGERPQVGADGKPYLTLRGRHYVLPADLLTP